MAEAKKKTTLLQNPANSSSTETENSVATRLSWLQAFSELKSFITLSNFNPGHNIIIEGHNNDSLFFLKSGTLGVYVGGERIGTLSEVGGVFGEMSLITGKPASATIMALTEVMVLVLKTDSLKQLEPESLRTQKEAELYRLYAKVLSERLLLTNQKASQFELANRELKEAQAKLKSLNEMVLESSAMKTQEFSASIDQLLTKLEAINDDLIWPSFNQVKKLSIKEQALLPPAENLIKAISEIESIIETQSKQNQIKEKRLIIIEAERKQQTLIRMSMGGAGIEIDFFENLEKAKENLAGGQFDLAIVNLPKENFHFSDFAKLDPKKTILVSSHNLKDTIQLLEQIPNRNFILRNDEERSFTIKSSVATVQKLITGDLFGIEKYLSIGVNIQELKVSDSLRRGEINQSVCEYFSSLGIRKNSLSQVSLVLEEMLMNSIYDAPTDNFGNSLFNHLPRSERIELKDHQAALVRFGCDGLYFGVSVVDPFGSLKQMELIKYLKSVYDGQAGIYNSQKGGAGRGLHMIVENSDVSIFNVKKGKKTEVICLWDLEAAHEKRETNPVLHYFFE